MATYNSLQTGAGVAGARTYPTSGVGMGGRTQHGQRGEVALTAAITTSDSGDLFYLPPRFRVTSGFIKCTDIDTNGAPAVVLAVGDADDDDRYFTASNVGQAGTYSEALAITGIDYITTKKTLVRWKCTTNAATGVAGTLIVVLFGMVEEPA